MSAKIVILWYFLHFFGDVPRPFAPRDGDAQRTLRNGLPITYLAVAFVGQDSGEAYLIAVADFAFHHFKYLDFSQRGCLLDLFQILLRSRV